MNERKLKQNDEDVFQYTAKATKTVKMLPSTKFIHTWWFHCQITTFSIQIWKIDGPAISHQTSFSFWLKCYWLTCLKTYNLFSIHFLHQCDNFWSTKVVLCHLLCAFCFVIWHQGKAEIEGMLTRNLHYLQNISEDFNFGQNKCPKIKPSENF